MRRILALGVVWLAAAGAAAAVAWQGVGLIGDQVTDRRPATLTADEIEAALDAGGTTTTGGATPGTAAGPADPGSTAPGGPGPAGEDAITRTFRVTGGSTALRFTPGA